MKALPVRRIVARARDRKIRLFLDFDGTLSPHRLDGLKSKPLPAARRALCALSRHPGIRAVIITGRSVADVRRRLRVPGITYVGNHGLVMAGPDKSFEHPRAAAAARSVRAAAALLRQLLKRHRGAKLCHHGLTLSLNVGMMAAEGRRAAAAAINALPQEMAGLRLRSQKGRLGWDILPEIDWDKGDALAHLIGKDRDALVIAIGDGASDEPMFERVGIDGVSIHVGRSADSKARYWVKGPRDVARFLRTLSR